MSDHDEVYMPSSLRNIVLPAESRHHLPHSMTYEEIRLYSESVHEIPHPHNEEHHPCSGKTPLKLASVCDSINLTNAVRVELILFIKCDIVSGQGCSIEFSFQREAS